MDKAYEGNGFREKVKQCCMRPVVPPKSNRKKLWKYNKKLYNLYGSKRQFCIDKGNVSLVLHH